MSHVNMASFLPHLVPSIRFKLFNDIFAVHIFIIHTLYTLNQEKNQGAGNDFRAGYKNSILCHSDPGLEPGEE
jgi:hypothetical protein